MVLRHSGLGRAQSFESRPGGRTRRLDRRPGFDMRALLTKFQQEYLHNLIRLIPDTVYIVDVEAVISAIIAEAARQDGVLYAKADWEKAVDKLLTTSREKPDFLGVKLQPELAIDLAPVVMFWLTVLLWHSVRRIDFSKKPFEEPWILTDIHGRSKGISRSLGHADAGLRGRRILDRPGL